MDAKDRQILRILQAEGRIANQDLAARVNLSPSPCLRRTRMLEESGVIEGYSARINQVAYGFPVTVFAQVGLADHSATSLQVFEDAIRRIDEVMECYMVSGDADFLLHIVMPDLNSYEAFVRRKLQSIPGLRTINSKFAYGQVKRRNLLPDPETRW